MAEEDWAAAKVVTAELVAKVGAMVMAADCRLEEQCMSNWQCK